jgi:hypothetical protein
VVIAVISLLGRHWYPSSDQAFEMLRIHDVGGSHTPLVGAWSRFGWAHPGPLLFWLLAPFYRMFGVTGVPAGVGLINVVCIIVTIVVAHRRGGVQLAALVGLMISLLAYTNGYDTLLDPWNPWAAFLPFVAFLVLVWSVLCGDLLMLPVAVVAGSFAAETHAGYLPLVAGLLLLATLWCIVPIVRDRHRVSIRRSGTTKWLAVAAGMGILAWVPPIVEQLSGGHNLRRVLSYSRHPNDPSAGWSEAFGVLGTELRLFGPWITGDDVGPLGFTVGSSVWPALLTIAAVIAMGWLAWQRGNRDAARLAVVVIAATGFGVIGTARVTGVVFPYVVHWWWGISALASLSIAWSVCAALKSVRLRTAITAICMLVLVANVAMLLRDLPTPVPGAPLSVAVAAVGPATSSALDLDHRYLVRTIDPLASGAVGSGLYFDLYRRGLHVFVAADEFSALQYGNWRTATPREVDAVVTIVDVPDIELGVFQPPAGSRIVASYDPLTPRQRARAHEIEVAIRAHMASKAPAGRAEFNVAAQLERDAAGVPRALSDELAGLERLGDGYVVYLTLPRA